MHYCAYGLGNCNIACCGPQFCEYDKVQVTKSWSSDGIELKGETGTVTFNHSYSKSADQVMVIMDHYQDRLWKISVEVLGVRCLLGAYKHALEYLAKTSRWSALSFDVNHIQRSPKRFSVMKWKRFSESTEVGENYYSIFGSGHTRLSSAQDSDTPPGLLPAH